MWRRRAGSRLSLDIALVYASDVVVFAILVSVLALRDHHAIANFDDWRIYDRMFSRPLGEWLFASQERGRNRSW